MINPINISNIAAQQKTLKSGNVNFKGIHNLAQDVLVISGKETKAKIFTNNVNYQTLAQIKSICSHPVFRDIPIRIMPDTHAGKGSCIGFTQQLNKENPRVNPNMVGVDIGCGMLVLKISP